MMNGVLWHTLSNDGVYLYSVTDQSRIKTSASRVWPHTLHLHQDAPYHEVPDLPECADVLSPLVASRRQTQGMMNGADHRPG
ncbi:hypothetical protein BDN71DRAFT_1494435, partial [Pleurotus eryngii]